MRSGLKPIRHSPFAITYFCLRSDRVPPSMCLRQSSIAQKLDFCDRWLLRRRTSTSRSSRHCTPSVIFSFCFSLARVQNPSLPLRESGTRVKGTKSACLCFPGCGKPISIVSVPHCRQSDECHFFALSFRARHGFASHRAGDGDREAIESALGKPAL